MAEDPDTPCVGIGHPEQHHQGRRLPRPVRSQERNDGPGLDQHVEIVHRARAAERLGETPGFYRVQRSPLSRWLPPK